MIEVTVLPAEAPVAMFLRRLLLTDATDFVRQFVVQLRAIQCSRKTTILYFKGSQFACFQHADFKYLGPEGQISRLQEVFQKRYKTLSTLANNNISQTFCNLDGC